MSVSKVVRTIGQLGNMNSNQPSREAQQPHRVVAASRRNEREDWGQELGFPGSMRGICMNAVKAPKGCRVPFVQPPFGRN